MPCWNYLLWQLRHNPYGFIFIPYLIVKSLVHLEVLRFFTKTIYPRERQRLRPRYGEAPTFTSDVIMAPFATRAVSIRNILFLKPTPNSPVHVDPTFIFIHCIYFYQVIWCEIRSTNHLKIMAYFQTLNVFFVTQNLLIWGVTIAFPQFWLIFRSFPGSIYPRSHRYSGIRWLTSPNS